MLPFWDLCKTIFDKLSQFSRSKPGKVDKKQKNIEKTAKFCENLESNFKNCSIQSLTKVLWKNFQSPKLMEKGLKTNTFPERSPVKVDCSVESHSKSLFSNSNEKLTITREGWKNKIPPENLSSQCSSVHAEKQFFWQPCYQVLPKRKVFRSKSQNLKKNWKVPGKSIKFFLRELQMHFR